MWHNVERYETEEYRRLCYRILFLRKSDCFLLWNKRDNQTGNDMRSVCDCYWKICTKRRELKQQEWRSLERAVRQIATKFSASLTPLGWDEQPWETAVSVNSHCPYLPRSIPSSRNRYQTFSPCSVNLIILPFPRLNITNVT